MGDFVILTDSSTDLTKDLRERFGITDYLPGIVVLPDGKKEDSTLDWELMSPDEYYGSMTKDAIYTTGIKHVDRILWPLYHKIQRELANRVNN